MNLKLVFKPLAVAIGATFSASLFAQEALTLEVTRPLPVSSTVVSLPTAQIKIAPSSDGGDLLRSLNGVSGSRMGGRGIDPVIRGQRQNQLNIILDGAFLYGGCPNRMDPPTTYTAAESYDRVTVIKGNRSVLYGPGGSGGTVLFERERPVLSEDKPYRGVVSGVYTGNSDTTQLSADLAAGSEKGYVRLVTEKTDAGNYTDGNDHSVRTSFESDSIVLLAGINLAERTWIEGSVEQANEKNVLFPGAGMDSPFSDSKTWRLKLDHQAGEGFVERVKAEIYRADVDHLMDNYSLRPQTAAMAMDAPTRSDTLGGRFQLDSRIRGHDIQWGVDHQENNRNASAIIAKGPLAGRISGIQWPDVTLSQTGLFGQVSHYRANGDLIKAGARYDYVRVNAGRTNEAYTAGMLNGQTPNALYGVNAKDKSTEHNSSGFVSWIHNINSQYRIESTFSRSVRTADASERYMAMNNWRGNPSLDPEKHHQLEVILASETADLSWSLAGYYNRVDDYILRQNNRYLNVDAIIYGVDFDMVWQLSPNVQFRNGVSWVRGKDRDNRNDLSQIPPLSTTLALDYRKNALRAGMVWEIAAKQNDVCISSSACGGQDTRQTPSYEVINLNVGYDLNSAMTVSAGINNLFDKTYAYHLNREDVFGNTAQINEPGRAGWLRLTARF